MRSPLPVWEMTYAHDRREHRHRCRCCNRIVEAGERVLMVKTIKPAWKGRPGRTYICHVEPCSELTADGMSWRQRFDVWARQYLKEGFGWSDKAIDKAITRAAQPEMEAA